MNKSVSVFVLIFLLAGCSSSDLVAKRYRPEFQNVIAKSNKSVLVLEPVVMSYKIDDPTKENSEASKHLTSVVQKAAILALERRAYRATSISDNNHTDHEIAALKSDLEKKSIIYMQKMSNLIKPEEALKLDDNFGESAITLGKIFNTDLIVAIRYITKFEYDNSPGALNGFLFTAIDSIAKSGISKQEVYYCYVVLIDSVTGNVLFSNNLYSTKKGWLYVSEKDLFKSDYIDQISSIIGSALP